MLWSDRGCRAETPPGHTGSPKRFCGGPLDRAGRKMIKRLVPLAALIGGAIVAMVLAPDAAWAEKRVALIVGNSAYQTVPQLPNPSRDANAVAKMFRDAGFDSVDVQLNVGNLEFKRAIRRFETRPIRPISPSCITPVTASSLAASII